MSPSSGLPAFFKRDILAISELSREEMLFVVETTRSLERCLPEIHARLCGRKMYYAFFEPSTRTRFSFVYAAKKLGMETAGFSSSSGTSAQKGEPLKDTLRMIQGYGADVIVLRHPLAGAALWGAENVDVPVVNAGDGPHEHPTQTLLDLYSILQSQIPERPWTDVKDLDGMSIAFVGDLKYGRTVHSLTTALSRFDGVTLRFVAPESLQMPLDYLEELEARGVPYTLHSRLEEVVAETDVLYMTRIQRERMPDPQEYERVKRVFHLTAEQLRHARPNLRVMHPLPRNKENLELDFSVDSTPHAYYYRQAEHGLSIRVALLALVSGGIETPPHVRTIPDPAHQRARFEPMKPGDGEKTRKYLFAIEDGTVIDHILPGRSGLVKSLLSIPAGVPVLVAQNLESRRIGSGNKDLIKIIGYKPSPTELNQIAIVSPDATISLIQNSRIVEKGKVVLPRYVGGLLICPNPSCISRPEYLEGISSLFRTLSRAPLVLQCYYCDSRVREEDVTFTGRG
jgi:aspartate carbamoyltransferase catalytic subunit